MERIVERIGIDATLNAPELQEKIRERNLAGCLAMTDGFDWKSVQRDERSVHIDERISLFRALFRSLSQWRDECGAAPGWWRSQEQFNRFAKDLMTGWFEQGYNFVEDPFLERFLHHDLLGDFEPYGQGRGDPAFCYRDTHLAPWIIGECLRRHQLDHQGHDVAASFLLANGFCREQVMVDLFDAGGNPNAMINTTETVGGKEVDVARPLLSGLFFALASKPSWRHFFTYDAIDPLIDPGLAKKIAKACEVILKSGGDVLAISSQGKTVRDDLMAFFNDRPHLLNYPELGALIQQIDAIGTKSILTQETKGLGWDAVKRKI